MVNALNGQVVVLMSVNKQHKGIIDNYRASQACINNSNKEMQKVYVKVKRVVGARWGVWVLFLCYKLLVTGVAPSAITKIITKMFVTMYGKHTRQVPSKNFAQKCGSVVLIVGETIVAIKLAQSELWNHIFFDATTCRQMPFQAWL